MPRFNVPRSTRTMYGTVTPVVVVVMARSAGVVPGVYGLKQLFGFGTAGGLGSGSAAEDDRFNAINAVINDWGTAIGNVLAHEIGHAVGVDHENASRNIMIAVTNAQDMSNANLPFGPRSLQILTQNLGVQN